MKFLNYIFYFFLFATCFIGSFVLQKKHFKEVKYSKEHLSELFHKWYQYDLEINKPFLPELECLCQEWYLFEPEMNISFFCELKNGCFYIPNLLTFFAQRKGLIGEFDLKDEFVKILRIPQVDVKKVALELKYSRSGSPSKGSCNQLSPRKDKTRMSYQIKGGNFR